MAEADERSSDSATAIADRNPLMTPDAVERVTAAAKVAIPYGTPSQHVSWASSGYGDPDGRG